VHGRELRSALCPLDIAEAEPDAVLRTLVGLAGTLLAGPTGSGPGERLIGIGVGLPGPISPGTGLPGSTTVLRRWTGYPVLDRIRAHWDVPLVLENDARALALGEAGGQGTGTLLGVKWASGIGAGLAVDGRSLAGDDGAAGDIGHIRVAATGPACRCGRQGCLAAYASGHALLGQLRPHGVRTLEEIAERSREGDPLIGPVLAAAAQRVGTVLASLIAMVNPRMLVLGGVIGALPAVVAHVDARIRDVTLPYSTQALRVVPSRLGERAATVGLVHLVTERVLAPEAINQALSTGAPAFGQPARPG
jgi:predicted NBD/HSP70 family sugar kinase